MKNRIDKKFRELKKQGKAALIVYITAGYPTLSKTRELVFEFQKSGVDIIELGVPFSDPLADGPTIQASSEAALRNNVSLRDIIALVKNIRRSSQIPIVFMTYYNPVYRFGVERFVKSAVSAGVDAVIVPDLPPEEAGDLIRVSRKSGFATIFLLAPTSVTKRMKMVSKASTGFIYYVSLAGVTGARKKLPQEIKGVVRRIKSFTAKPVCVGFGVSGPQQAKEIARIADGVIVGSAVISVIQKNAAKLDLVKKAARFVKGLSNAIHCA